MPISHRAVADLSGDQAGAGHAFCDRPSRRARTARLLPYRDRRPTRLPDAVLLPDTWSAVYHELPHPLSRLCAGAAPDPRILVLCAAAALSQQCGGHLRGDAFAQERACCPGLQSADVVVAWRRYRVVSPAKDSRARRWPRLSLCRTHCRWDKKRETYT